MQWTNEKVQLLQLLQTRQAVVTRLESLQNEIKKAVQRTTLKHRADEMYSTAFDAVILKKRLLEPRRMLVDVRRAYVESGFTRGDEYIRR